MSAFCVLQGAPPYTLARMPKAFEDWNVLPHGPIEVLAENLRWVQGSLPGMSLKRVMTVARMADGRLVIHNAIALEDGAMKEIEAFGTPAFLIVPNGGHRLDAPAYKKRYPALSVFAPKGARKKVEEVISFAVPDDDTRRSDQRRPSPARRTKDAP